MVQEISIIAIVLLAITVNFSTAFQWIALQPGDDIPKYAVLLDSSRKLYVGRARHFDEVLPAEINSTVAVVTSCNKKITKHQYEILVSKNNCYWQRWTKTEDISENIVRVGTASNLQPTYIGKMNSNNYQLIKTIYLTLNYDTYVNVLVCEESSIWVDTFARNIPNNTVSGGVSNDGNPIYVARLKAGCSIIPGQVTPAKGVASAVYNHENLKSKYSQVLTYQHEEEYIWVPASDGEIPDHAVVGSKDKNGELMYIALINKTLGYVISSTAARMNTTYEILVNNKL